MLDKIIGMSGNITVHLSDRREYVIDIDTTYGGQTSLSTLGTVTIGNWHAAIINPSYGGTGVDNGGFIITLGGSLYTTGAITLESDEGSIVSLPARGRLVNRSETIDPEQNLKDVADISKAYDNLAPVVAKGDIVVFDGESNFPLPITEDGKWLCIDKSAPLGVEWHALPSSYSTITYKNMQLPKEEILSFHGDGFIIKPNQGRTDIQLTTRLQAIEGLTAPGILAYGPRFEYDPNPIQPRVLLADDGIQILNGYGEDNPVIKIHPEYKGQKSITTVGHIKEGYWGGTIVDPEFGGTGNANVYGISLGGHLHTTAPFSVMQMTPYSPNDKLEGYYVQENSVTLVAEGTTEVWLPKKGMLATQEDSLQVCHNLGDLDNKLQAFSNISPTKKRGDMIVRGYGDYDTVLQIGAIGQVLTVVEDEPGLVEWTDPVTYKDIDLRIEEQLSNITVEIRESMEPESQLLGGMPMETVLEAILMQFDYMKHAGTLPVIKELRTVLDQWTKSKQRRI